MYDKYLALTKLKAFADGKFKIAKTRNSAFNKVEVIVGKEENAGFQHFLHFLQCSQKASCIGSLKVVIVWLKVKTHDFVVEGF